MKFETLKVEAAGLFIAFNAAFWLLGGAGASNFF
jgi:hypothetical protein